MNLTRRALLGTTAAVATVPAGRRARAQSANTIKIGVLNDQSGPYTRHRRHHLGDLRQAGGRGIRRAKGFNVEVITADHQNKPDLGASIARQWFDRDGVDMILDVPTSSVALAVAGVSKEKNKVYLNIGAATSDLTGKAVLTDIHPLCLRHLHAGEVDRRRDGEGRRRQLVFHHRRLRLRPAVAEATPPPS